MVAQFIVGLLLPNQKSLNACPDREKLVCSIEPTWIPSAKFLLTIKTMEGLRTKLVRFPPEVVVLR